jgi:diguanylate cyclase (GGDEF)-like protein
MQSNLVFDPHLSAEELRGFTRTVAEIEWLLLILVLLYQVVVAPTGETAAAMTMAMFFFAAFILGFHYANFYRKETYWKLAIETWAMIVFITWVLLYTGRLESPLLNLYLLVIITSALTLGKLSTLMQMALIAACYVWLGHPERIGSLPMISYLATLATQLAPLVLVAYITTMLSADIRRALMQVKLLSETDDLTGALNMRAFNMVSERIFRHSMRYSHPFSVLMIDSDSLKSVNDAHGHEAGNRLLKMIIQCIRTHLRDTDYVARYGGDEFVVLLPETPCSAATAVAARIRQEIESMALATRTEPIRTTVSIGIACYPDHGSNLDIILEKADLAMYSSKSEGKNRTTVYGEK